MSKMMEASSNVDPLNTEMLELDDTTRLLLEIAETYVFPAELGEDLIGVTQSVGINPAQESVESVMGELTEKEKGKIHSIWGPGAVIRDRKYKSLSAAETILPVGYLWARQTTKVAEDGRIMRGKFWAVVWGSSAMEPEFLEQTD